MSPGIFSFILAWIFSGEVSTEGSFLGVLSPPHTPFTYTELSTLSKSLSPEIIKLIFLNSKSVFTLPLIPTLWRQISEFKDSQGYIKSPCLKTKFVLTSSWPSFCTLELDQQVHVIRIYRTAKWPLHKIVFIWAISKFLSPIRAINHIN